MSKKHISLGKTHKLGEKHISFGKNTEACGKYI
jgi:hypothetical protein